MTLLRILVVQILLALAALTHGSEWQQSGQRQCSGAWRSSIMRWLSGRKSDAASNRKLGGLPKNSRSNNQSRSHRMLAEAAAL